MDIGRKICRLRTEKNISQEELAKQLTVTRLTVSRWECGYGLPDTEKLVKLSNILGCSIDYLLRDDIEEPAHVPPPAGAGTEKPATVQAATVGKATVKQAAPAEKTAVKQAAAAEKASVKQPAAESPEEEKQPAAEEKPEEQGTAAPAENTTAEQNAAVESEEAETKSCPVCGLRLADDAVFCVRCGSKIVDGKVVCPECGEPAVADSDYCVKCGKKLRASKEAPPVPPRERGLKHVRAAAKQKPTLPTVIASAVLAFLSFMIMLFTTLHPVKVRTMLVVESPYAAWNEQSTVGLSVEVDQTVWQLFSSYEYRHLDRAYESEKARIDALVAAVNREYEAAREEASKVVFESWAITTKEKEEMYKKEMEKALSSKLSGTDYIAYVYVTSKPVIDRSGEEPVVVSGDIALYEQMYVTAIALTVTAAVGFLLALCALASFIAAVCGMVKKKDVKPKKIMLAYLCVSGGALILNMFTPLAVPTGAMYAVAFSTAVLLALLGVSDALFFSEQPVPVIVRRGVSAWALLVAFFLFSSDVITLTHVSEFYSLDTTTETVTVNGPIGMLFETVFASFSHSLYGVVPAADLSGAAYADIGALALLLGAAVMMFVAFVFAVQALHAGENGRERSCVLPVAAAAMSVAAFIVAGALSGYLCGLTSEVFRVSEAEKKRIIVSTVFGAPLYVSAVFAIFAAIFTKTFYSKKYPRLLEPEQGRTFAH